MSRSRPPARSDRAADRRNERRSYGPDWEDDRYPPRGNGSQGGGRRGGPPPALRGGAVMRPARRAASFSVESRWMSASTTRVR
ncbi:MAG: hypothetical protein ACK5E6_09460, partial [Cyanobacteriota bacterium]